MMNLDFVTDTEMEEMLMLAQLSDDALDEWIQENVEHDAEFAESVASFEDAVSNMPCDTWGACSGRTCPVYFHCQCGVG